MTDDILRYFVCMSTCGHPFPLGWFPEVSVIMTIAGLAASLNFGTPRLPPSFPGSSVGKESTCNAGDTSSISGPGRSPGEGKDYPLQYSWACLVAQLVKNPSAIQETWVQSLGQEDPLEKEMAPHSSTLPGKSHGQRSLVGYSPWGRKE